MKKKLSTYFTLLVMLSSIMLTPVTALVSATTNEPVVAENQQGATESATSSKIEDSSQQSSSSQSSTTPPIVEDNNDQQSSQSSSQSSVTTATDSSKTSSQASTSSKPSTAASSSSSSKAVPAPKATPAPLKSTNSIFGENGFFTGAKYTDTAGNPVTEVHVGDDILLTYTWAIPEDKRSQIFEGDTYEFTLPEGLEVVRNLSGELPDATGRVFGTFTVDTNGKAVITFTKNVEKFSNIKGTFFVKGSVKSKEDGTLIDLDVPFVDSDHVTVPDIVAPDQNDLSKAVTYQTPNKEIEQNKATITWRLNVNRSGSSLKDATIEDALPTGVTFKDIKSVTAYNINPDGSKGAAQTVLASSILSTSNNVNFKFKDGLSDAQYKRYYEIEFNTEVDFSKVAVTQNATSIPITNKAILKRPGKTDLPASATATFGYGVDFTKVGQMQSNGVMKWIITVASNGLPLPKGTVLTDVMNNWQEITNSAGDFLTGDALKNSVVTSAGGPKVEVTGPTGNSSKTYRFTLTEDAKSNSTFTLTYYSKSKVPTGSAVSSNYNNRISWGSSNGTNTPTTDRSSLVKRLDGGLNTTDHTQGYNIVINGNNRLITEATLRDVMNTTTHPGLTMSKAQIDAIEIRRMPAGAPANAPGTVVPKTQYDIVTVPNNTDPGTKYTEFTIDLKKALGDTGSTDRFEIRYRSSYDATKNGVQQRNTAYYNYVLYGTRYSTNATANITPSAKVKLSGNKSGAINPIDATITWVIKLNTSKLALGTNGKLEDTLPAGVSINDNKAGTVPTNLYTVKKGDTAINNVTATYDPTTRVVTFTGFEAGDKSEYEITLITYSDHLKDEDATNDNIEAKNTAVYTDDDNYTEDLIATVSYNASGDLINKTHLPPEGMEVTYNVKVNPDTKTNPADNKLKLYNVVVKDTPDDTSILRIDTGSFKVTYSSTGLPVPSTVATLVATEQGFTLTFRTVVEQEINIQYKAKVLIPAGTKPGAEIKPKNSVTITGLRKEATKTDDGIKIEVPDAGGNAEGILGSLTVHKTDAKTNSDLYGARFELYRLDKDGNKGSLVKDDYTDRDGKLLFDHLTLGQYLLVETEAPANHEILPEYKNGKVITISDKDEEFLHQDLNVKNNEITDISGEKTWNDKDNQDGKRPTFITVRLFDVTNGQHQEVRQTTTTLNNNWAYKFEGLRVYNDHGDKIQYKVEEDAVPGYTVTTNGYELVNKHTPETTSLEGKKTWKDNDDQDGVRPKSIKINLLADGQPSQSKTVTEADKWEYKFTNLPKYQNGKEIKYTVTEDIVKDYTTTIDSTGKNVTNTYQPGKTSVSVTKAWNDNNDQDGIRPKEIKVQLYADGQKHGDAVTLTATDKWTYTWSDLDAKKDHGKEIVYTVKEVGTIEGYDIKLDDTNKGNIIITNSHKPSTTEVKGTKTWNDKGDQDGIRPESITVNLLANGTEIDSKKVTAADDWKYSFTNLPEYQAGKKITYAITEDTVFGYSGAVSGYDLINSYTPGKTSATVTKSWKDNNNQDGLRPESIKVQLYANGQKHGDEVTLTAADKWTHTWNDLDLRVNHGELITYTVKEINAGPGYTTTVDTKNQSNMIITNSHTPSTTEVKGTKTWSDKDNQDGKRPASIKVNLMAHGQVVDSKTVTAADDWKYSFTDLPEYEAGQKISYTVTEDTVDEYSTEIHGFNLTNDYTPGKTSATVTKAWDDNEDQDGIRPESIKVQLYANGQKRGDVVTLTATEDWTHTWEDLDAKQNGQDIVYTVQEVNPVNGYDIKVNDENHGNMIITNTHTPTTTEVRGVKTWSDKDNQDGIRPTSISVNLLANGQPVDAKTVTAKDSWEYSFTDLPEHEAGQKIIYTVTEDTVEEYSTEINEYDLANSYTPGKTSATVTKAWSDNENQDGIRPNSIKVQLYADGQKHGDVVTITEAEDWTHTWEDLDAKQNGQDIVYTVKEVDTVDGYSVVVNDENHGNMIITNAHTPATTEVKGTKTWDDNDDQDGKRPASIIVNLLSNGNIVDTKTVTAEDDWKYSFTDLPEYEAGEKISYTITEDTVNEYSTEINDYNLTNQYTPGKTSATVTKAWADNNDQDGLRPESIKVQLYADGQKHGDAVTLTAKEDWTHTWTDLDAKKNKGQEIVYTVKEVGTVDGYTVAVNNEDHGNLMITNSHTPATTKVNGTKTWKDSADQDGKRPTSITVNLLADGKVAESKTITAKDDWKYSFTDLPEYQAGQKVVYTVTEDTVKDYSTEIDGYDLTNSYTPGKTSATVTKAWADNNDQDGLRPESIQVQLYADGVKLGDVVTLAAANKWTHAWAELDAKKNGKVVDYTVKEVGTVKGYTATVNDDNQGNLIITNTHTPKVPTKPQTPSTPSKPSTPGKVITWLKERHLLPQTGEEAQVWLVVAGAIIILTIGGYVIRKRVEDN